MTIWGPWRHLGFLTEEMELHLLIPFGLVVGKEMLKVMKLEKRKKEWLRMGNEHEMSTEIRNEMGIQRGIGMGTTGNETEMEMVRLKVT